MAIPLLDKRRTIAPPGFNRWLVPCAALAVHLSIGMAYGFSVFWLPLGRAVGVDRPARCPAGTTFLQELAASEVKVASEEAETTEKAEPTSPLVLALAWMAVAIPMAWGVAVTLQKAARLFG